MASNPVPARLLSRSTRLGPGWPAVRPSCRSAAGRFRARLPRVPAPPGCSVVRLPRQPQHQPDSGGVP
eukprot:751584-Hanusia_phi.AAC.1